MPLEPGARTPASEQTADENVRQIGQEMGTTSGEAALRDYNISDRLRASLQQAGLKGFRRGGKVKRTGVYKLHKGERVLNVRQARKLRHSRGNITDA